MGRLRSFAREAASSWGSLHRQMSHIKRIRLLLGSKPLADEYENDLADLAPLASYSSLR